MEENNYYQELLRITAKYNMDKEDADILSSAAFKLIPGPTPKHESCDYIPGYGYLVTQQY